MSSKVEQKINDMLCRYLKAEHGIDTGKAWLSETDVSVERGWSDGCDTCGHGRDDTETSMSFYIRYHDDNANWGKISSVMIGGDPLNFFPTLMQYEESM